MSEFDYHRAFAVDECQARRDRPDIAELLGPRFDQPRGELAPKTLIICAAPRTGSYELARYLTAAGMGVPHEYFNPVCAAAIAGRWGLSPDPLAPTELGDFIGELRRRRSPGGVLAIKLQYWQYVDTLRNEHGRALFAGAVVVHLFRADVVSQFASWRRACELGSFDFTDRVTHQPRDTAAVSCKAGLTAMLDQLVGDDAGFRRLFVCAGVRPVFCETAELVRDPRPLVAQVAAALGITLDQDALERAIAAGARYPGGEDTPCRIRETQDLLADLAFST